MSELLSEQLCSRSLSLHPSRTPRRGGMRVGLLRHTVRLVPILLSFVLFW